MFYNDLYNADIDSNNVADKPLIINTCLTGIVAGKTDNPNIPISTSEIIEDACRVIEAGANMLHIHARDQDGKAAWQPDIYEKIISSIRKYHHDVILVATTSGRAGSDFEHRSAVLNLDGSAKPDMASLTLGSMNFPTGASVNEPSTVLKLLERMHQMGIKPELEVFDMGMLNYAFYLTRKKVIKEPCFVNILLGSLGTSPARLQELGMLTREIPASWTWAAAGIGRFQLATNVAAMIAGGHVRVGLEDAIYMDTNKQQPASNLALVERIVRLSKELGRPIASPADARRMLGLS